MQPGQAQAIRAGTAGATQDERVFDFPMSRCGRRMGRRDRPQTATMGDILMFVMLVAAFAGAGLYVGACDRMTFR